MRPRRFSKREETVARSVPARFQRMVERHGSTLAVVSDSWRLTYDGLERAANGLARALLARGGEEHETVALLLPADAPRIVALLGVLKARRIFLLVDPEWPRNRAAAVLGDARASCIVTDREHRERARALARGRCDVLDLDALDGATKGPAAPIEPDRPGWIDYEKSRGVLQSHRALLHDACDAYAQVAHIGPDDRVAGAGVRDALCALLNGATAWPRAGQRLRGSVTVYHDSPRGFRRLCAGLGPTAAVPPVRLVRLAGAPVRPDDIRLFRKHFPPDCALMDAYARRETGDVSLCFLDRARGVVRPATASDGKQVLVLDPGGRPLRAGGIGEIAVRSRYLALGYWRDLERTRAAFVADPNDADVRTFCTGDLGRVRLDGGLEYLGRRAVSVRQHEWSPLTS